MFKRFKKTTKNSKNLLDISNKFSSNDIVCKQMLELLNNNVTNVKLDVDINNSYYVFLNDTIYLTDKEKNKESYQRICNVAHECIHSIQNKVIQFINFVLSNVEMLAFIIVSICMAFKFHTNIVFYSYLILNIVSMIPRLILEIDATKRSISLSKKYMESKIEENESSILLKQYENQIFKLFPIFIMSLLMDRITRIAFIFLLRYIQN